jgi:hypothetical protein
MAKAATLLEQRLTVDSISTQDLGHGGGPH